MPGEKPQDAYGEFGSVPTVSPQMGSAANLNVHANPDDFGAQTGQAIAGAGKEAFDLAQHFQTVAVESKANDDYANKYVPAAAALREKYDSLDGQDKVHGYEDYMSGLKDLNAQFTENQNPLYKLHIGGQIDRRSASEVDGATRELVQSQKQFATQGQYDLIKSNEDYAIKNYNNPNIVKDIVNQNNALTTLQYIDNGHDPSHPVSAELIDNAQRQQQGSLATGMIKQAINTGDISTANNLRAENAAIIPAAQQLHTDSVLHQANLQASSANAMAAIKSGVPIPNTIGAPPSEVQAAVADAAHNSGVNQNHALTVLRIESSDGQNLGARGTIGQTGHGTTLQEQASDLVNASKQAQVAADKALGRPSDPWEQYLCYQQGATGGTTLLRAAQDNPAAKAVDLLTDVYGNRKSALSAIVNNGGNPSMTSNDFLGFIKQKYDANAQRAQCAVPPLTNLATQTGQNNAPAPTTSPDLGKAILDVHNTPTQAIQPSATPRQALTEWESKAPDYLAKINSIPNYETRNRLMQAFEKDKSEHEQASNLYTKVIVDKAVALGANPNFTDINQLSHEQQSELLANHPQTYEQLVKQADFNTKHSAQERSKNTVTNSPNFYENLQRSLQSNGDETVPNSITNETQLYKLLGRKDNLGINTKDYSDIKGSLNMDNGWKKFLSDNLTKIKSANGNMDGLGEQRASNFYFAANQMKDELLQNKKYNINDLSNSDDKNNPILGLLPNHTATKGQQVSNMAKKIQDATPLVSVPSDQRIRPGESVDDLAKRLGI